MTGKHRKKKDKESRVEEKEPQAKEKEKLLADIESLSKKKKKRRIWIYVLIGILLLGGVGGSLFYFFGCQKDLKKSLSRLGLRSLKIPGHFVFCPLDGRQVKDESLVKRRPLVVKVENLSDARPQSGLDKADIIYEAMAEGGITRFAVVYLCQDVEEIGPVRSARLQDIDFVREFDGLFAHCGGSDAYMDASKAGMADMDEFTYEEAYWRSDERYAPHNLYTSTKRLREAAQKAGLEQETPLRGYLFKKGEPGKNKALSIKIPYPAACDVQYTYDAKTNIYLRSVAGEPHTDKVTASQLAPKNVIIQYISYSYSDYGEEYGMGGRQMMELVGEGRAQIFLDGNLIEGRWTKAAASEPTIFTDAGGQEIKFNRGQIWISIVPESYSIEISGQ